MKYPCSHLEIVRLAYRTGNFFPSHSCNSTSRPCPDASVRRVNVLDDISGSFRIGCEASFSFTVDSALSALPSQCTNGQLLPLTSQCTNGQLLPLTSQCTNGQLLPLTSQCTNGQLLPSPAGVPMDSFCPSPASVPMDSFCPSPASVPMDSFCPSPASVPMDSFCPSPASVPMDSFCPSPAGVPMDSFCPHQPVYQWTASAPHQLVYQWTASAPHQRHLPCAPSWTCHLTTVTRRTESLYIGQRSWPIQVAHNPVRSPSLPGMTRHESLMASCHYPLTELGRYDQLRRHPSCLGACKTPVQQSFVHLNHDCTSPDFLLLPLLGNFEQSTHGRWTSRPAEPP